MAKLIILGSGWAVPTPDHESTYLAVDYGEGLVLIDCPSTPTYRLERVGKSIDDITDMVVTHFHPDHVGGVPSMLMNMWMLGRQAPLRIYGLHHCLERLEDMMGFFHWDNWPEFFPVAFHRLPERERILVLEKKDFRILCSPVRHIVPTIGLRFESTNDKIAIAYSCDTEPCPSVVRLATGADVLIHEATGSVVGHSSASQAGAIAREAGVNRLLLIHYRAGMTDVDALVEQARETYTGEIALAEDYMELDL